MKANELRLGNLLFYNKYGINNNIAVESLYVHPVSNEMSVGNKGVSIPISDLTPIPLTEEWLIKLGGINHGNIHTLKKYVFIKKDNYWEVEERLEWKQDNKTHSRFFKIAKIKHVHTLQNFIFANKGEELQVK